MVIKSIYILNAKINETLIYWEVFALYGYPMI